MIWSLKHVLSKLAATLDFEPFEFSQQNICYRTILSMIIIIWDTEVPIVVVFSAFFPFCGGYFEDCSGREVHHKLFPVDIIDSYSIFSPRCSVMKTSWYSQYFPHCWSPVDLPYRQPVIVPLLLARFSSVVKLNNLLANSWVAGDLRRPGAHVTSLQWQALEPFRVTPIPSSTNGTTSDNSWSVLRIRVTFDTASKCVICTNSMYKNRFSCVFACPPYGRLRNTFHDIFQTGVFITRYDVIFWLQMIVILREINETASGFGPGIVITSMWNSGM